jgi:uncharacterized protein (TIGR00288 family)
MHRGPQAHTAPLAGAQPLTHGIAAPFHHAPNAALLIDFDNVTMGIRSDLGHELRNLLGSDIIKGKVAVQRAYADWRRYPQYIVPLAESSIDMIMAPAYGSSKKNATDIRLAVDAMELVFTRPEIGTYILLSGDSDFASLVTKLKEYGKYVIGVGIRESSSDLLVMNCDEYYSYNALAGLVKASEEEVEAQRRDPWELVSEAILRMKRNGDVMRSDRLKQVMQEIDATFDEKDQGFSKFSKFAMEAAQRGLLSVTKLDNGQLEVDLPQAGRGADLPVHVSADERLAEAAEGEDFESPAREGREPRREARDGREGRSRRGRRGRGRDREPRAEGEEAAGRPPRETRAEPRREVAAEVPPTERSEPEERRPPREAPAAAEAEGADAIGISGERLTRDEAFDLVRRAVSSLTIGEDDSVRATVVRERAREILARDSESLSDRNFTRILRDAHDADVIDLRRRGDDFEVARAAEAAPVAEQLARAAAATGPSPTAAAPAPARRGMGPRGLRAPGRGPARGVATPPPDLFSVGVIDIAPEPAALGAMPSSSARAAEVVEEITEPAPAPAVEHAPAKRARGRKSGGAKRAAKSAKSAEGGSARSGDGPTPRRPRARKSAAKEGDA